MRFLKEYYYYCNSKVLKPSTQKSVNFINKFFPQDLYNHIVYLFLIHNFIVKHTF